MDGNDRSKRVLAALVRQYIATGEPIASSVLVTSAGLGVSSATVRHLLAGLEDEGYLSQPHPSAGRVPTDRGYRFYVDLLLEQKRPRGAATPARGPAAARRLRIDDRLAASAGLARAVPGVTQHRVCRSARQRSGGLRPRRVRPAQLGARPGGHRRARRACHPEGHRRRRIASGRRSPAGGELSQRRILRNAAQSRARSRARAPQRGTAPVRRAARTRDAAGHVDVFRPARANRRFTSRVRRRSSKPTRGSRWKRCTRSCR